MAWGSIKKEIFLYLQDCTTPDFAKLSFMASTFHLVNSSTGERLAVPEGTVELGRSRSAGITIPDPSLSRIHARLYNVAEGFWVEDLGSTNGTYVLGNRLSEPTHLPAGEKVQFGDLVFFLEETSEAVEATQTAPPVPEPQDSSPSGPMPQDPTVTLYRRKTSLVPQEVIQHAINATASSTPKAPAKPLPAKYSLSDSGRIRPEEGKNKAPAPLETRAPAVAPEPKVPWPLFVAIGTGVGLLLGLIIGLFFGSM